MQLLTPHPRFSPRCLVLISILECSPTSQAVIPVILAPLALAGVHDSISGAAFAPLGYYELTKQDVGPRKFLHTAEIIEPTKVEPGTFVRPALRPSSQIIEAAPVVAAGVSPLRPELRRVSLVPAIAVDPAPVFQRAV